MLLLNTPTRKELLDRGPPLDGAKNILGRGTYGIVYKALYNSKPVAVKIIKNTSNCHGRMVIQNEMHLLGLKHPNIIYIFKIESNANYGIVIMERFTGFSLQIILDYTELHITHRIYIVLDIVSALKYIHKRNILHLDIKPKNIMISWHCNGTSINSRNCQFSNKPFTCKLCDFGSSLFLDKSDCNFKGLIKGTVRYMAPEALKEEHITLLTDIYSVGIIMWQLKYRILPYKWLPCNEMVAYQVVKNNIRPNSVDCNDLEGKEMNINSPPQRADYSVMQDFLSIHNIFYLSGCESIRCVQNEKNDNNFESNMSQRSPLQNLTNNNVKQIRNKEKVKCNLMQKFSSQENFVTQIEEVKEIKATSTFSYVDNVSCISPKEKQYQKLYESCWDCDQKNRPSSNVLYKLLKKLV